MATAAGRGHSASRAQSVAARGPRRVLSCVRPVQAEG